MIGNNQGWSTDARSAAFRVAPRSRYSKFDGAFRPTCTALRAEVGRALQNPVVRTWALVEMGLILGPVSDTVTSGRAQLCLHALRCM